MSNTIQSLEARIDHLENHSRPCNLIIYGLPESEKEDTESLEQAVNEGYKLKNTEYSIGQDFSLRVREVRRKLWASAKTNREKHDKVSLAFDKLYINNVAYVWDENKNDKLLLQKNENNKPNRPLTRSCMQMQYKT
ncbi:uncharacterized protein [Dermacentor andersoni]|uniref:uncharacterized protein n=1 Tax=Dermacentor andersoni TaxID=34620 RepID=UPI003B3A2EB6